MDASAVFVRIYEKLQEVARSATAIDVATGIAILCALRITFRIARDKLKTTRLRGPPRKNLIFGWSQDLLHAEDAGSMYEAWATEYGVAYEVPTTLGGRKIMLCDPRALAHFYGKETWTYVPTEFDLLFIRKNFGKAILCAQGEDHKRQRRSLSPAFSHVAIRKLLPVFYNSAYKVGVLNPAAGLNVCTYYLLGQGCMGDINRHQRWSQCHHRSSELDEPYFVR